MNDQVYKFSNAEIAVIFEQLFGPDLLPRGNLFADLKVDEAGLKAARQSLVKRGIMHRAPDPSAIAFKPSVLTLFQAATRPQVLGILQIGSPGKPPKEMYFSWTADGIVQNHVDEQNTHVFELLSSVEAIGEAAVRETGIGGLTEIKPDLAGNPEAVITSATLLVIFMVVTNLQAPEQDAQAISWTVSNNQVWLISRQEGDHSAMEPVVAETIRTTVVAMVNRAVELRQAAQA